MLKHVSVSPWRGRADSVSLASSGGASSCGSGSPSPGHTPPPSRASSCASLAPLTALSSFSPTDATSQQVNRRKSRSNHVSSYIDRPRLFRSNWGGKGWLGSLFVTREGLTRMKGHAGWKKSQHSAKRERSAASREGTKKQWRGCLIKQTRRTKRCPWRALKLVVSWKREQNDSLHLLTAGPRVSLSVRANRIHRRDVCLIHDYFWRSRSLGHYRAKNSRDCSRLCKRDD